LASIGKLDSKLREVQALAEADLETFIALIAPYRVFGEVHREYFRFITRGEKKSHQLVLLPRDHQKSAIAGYYAAWRIVRNPAIRILYVSSTANLAIKQLKFIKDILTCAKFRRYWPEYVNLAEGRREKWSETEIAIDHPLRKAEGIRDSTVFTAGLTTNTTGLHSDLSIYDDIVVYENAYNEEGRLKTEQQYSLLASIEGTDAEQLVVGTRYFPNDIYGTMIDMKISRFDQDGELIFEEDMYEVFERKVEDRGDGTGQYLWPRQQTPSGKWFGFNQDILERKRTQYLDTVQFRAQYYNDPNDPAGAGIGRENFQYYEPKFLTRTDGHWFYKQSRLNVFAAIDFAYSLAKKADFTAIVILGVDKSQNYYVLEIDRFKTRDISDYFIHILKMHQKWDFRKIRAEVTAAQYPIVEAIKKDYIRVHGLALSIDEHRPTRHDGTKEERIRAALQPKYRNSQIFHYLGGNCSLLEEELVLSKPSHDDIKDALASVIDIAVAPSSQGSQFKSMQTTLWREHSNKTYGGFG